MFPIIWADILRVSVLLSSKALSTTGMMRAKEGASMKWTNLVCRRVWRQVEVLRPGSWRADNRVGTIAAKNGRKFYFEGNKYKYSLQRPDRIKWKDIASFSNHHRYPSLKRKHIRWLEDYLEFRGFWWQTQWVWGPALLRPELSGGSRWEHRWAEAQQREGRRRAAWARRRPCYRATPQSLTEMIVDN